MKAILPILLVFSAQAFSATPELPSNLQYILGNCNLVINNSEGGNVQAPKGNLCPDSPASKSAADSLNKLARFIEASNPTKLEVAELKPMKFLGDNEPFLVAIVENKSNLPARKVKLELLRPLQANEKNSKIIKVPRSNAFPQKIMQHLQVAQHDSQTIPLAPLSYLIDITRLGLPSDYIYLGAGLTPELPQKLMHSFSSDATHRNLQAEIRPLGLAIQYENIFETSTKSLSGIYFYFARNAKAD
ncbi:hypothetical protein KSS94_04395 [Pseudomonas fakonensis]|uniref:Uncharacterized protein n=1 Tax=Pseudomonas fakonensis TaxID=2842355 RepID=A0ABX8N7P3_9PSED|nr:hypothetical protein [Pseudomonas fakonensis]QXH52374.1 hypothetical protein KSS94_04395 [Pseudomonas fakonensis]